MNILVLQPTRPSNPPALRARAEGLLWGLVTSNPGMTFDVRQDDTALEIPAHPSLYMRHATVRNYLLDTYLKDEHTHVLWVDSDLIDYPAELPTLLMGVVGETQTICAPLAVLDDTHLTQKNRFYDIGGFIENGKRARMYPPWFDQQGDVIELDSVGCCYLAPAALYRSATVPGETTEIYTSQHFFPAARYSPPHTDYYVEHWSVMQAAKKRGYRICALTTAIATHAWLPDYGMRPN